MRDSSKILFIISDFANKIEKAYQNSQFLRLCKKTKEIWQHSITGKILSGFFDYDVQNNSLFLKCIKSTASRFVMGTANFFSFKEAIGNSKYIKVINRLTSNINFNKMKGFKTVFKNSFFINTISEYWEAMD